MVLLSSSMDKTMMIWKPNKEENGIWINEVRVGEMGGNTLGFYGGLFSPDGSKILAHGYNGAFHLWSVDPTTFLCSPSPTVSGHFAPVNECAWHPTAPYFLTVSQDQTARIFAPWFHTPAEGETSSKVRNGNYFEISRAQIHGHDLQCGTFILPNQHRFVTGAEEKVCSIYCAFFPMLLIFSQRSTEYLMHQGLLFII